MVAACRPDGRAALVAGRFGDADSLIPEMLIELVFKKGQAVC
ncbi:hypothetical protein ABDB91_03080 [Desulfoscipio sp. XC116]